MDLVSQRLSNQKLSAPEFRQAVDVVRWLGAVQAQDFNAAKWALGLRMRRATEAEIDDAYNEGKILRTHLMRPTWHFVAPEDIRWLLQLTAPRVNLRCTPNYRKLELDGPLFKRSNKILTDALKGGKHLTRSELKIVLNRSGIASDDPIRLAHIMIRAELDGVVCSGARKGKQFTYALLEERVPATKPLTRDEALAKLARRFFSSHGPATLQDFIWWSGLIASEAQHAIGLVERHLSEELVQKKVYWKPKTPREKPSGRSKPPLAYLAHLLPAYDEYNVAYKDRQVVLDEDTPELSTWGLLSPTIVINGKVVGTWKSATDRKSVKIEMNPARSLSKSEKVAVAEAAERYAAFLAVPLASLKF